MIVRSGPPSRFALGHETNWMRDLRCALVPMSSGSSRGHAFDLVRKQSPTTDNGCVFNGEVRGVAVRHLSGKGMVFPADTVPRVPPITVFSHLIRRDSGAAIQPLIGNGFVSNGGWTLQLSYGSGQLGITRWGIADHASSILVPFLGNPETSVGLVWDGSTARFMVDGKFSNLSVGNPSSVSNAVGYGIYPDGSGGLLDHSLFVTYVWARLLSDGEMQALRVDPWRVVRPQEVPWLIGATGGGGGGGSGARVFVPAFIG